MSDESGYDLTDPKHHDYHDRMSSLTDDRRKAERETAPITPAAREAVENLLDVSPLDWTEQDARETISHLGYYEMAEEGSLRRILSLPERDRLRSARTYMAGLDAGGESGIRFLLDGLGVESIHQLGRICRAAAETVGVYEGLRVGATDGTFALWNEDSLLAALHALGDAVLRAEVPAGGKTS